MERSLERDSMTIDSQVSLVSKVWFLCENSQHSPVRLLLPDEKEIPYYLNKCTKFSTKKWELSSMDSIESSTQLSDLKRSPRRRKIKLSSLLPAIRRAVGKELRIEEALLKPYRESEEAKQELLLKYASKPKSSIKSPRFELQPPRQLKTKRSPRVNTQLESSHHTMPLAMKGIQYSVPIKEQSITEFTPNDAGYSHAAEAKKMLWCTIVSALIAFQNVTLKVQKMRRIRNLDIRKWNAALVIQRNWRYQFYIRRQNHPQSSPRNKRNKSWRGCYTYNKNSHRRFDISRDNIKGRTVCEHRGQSCALITRFLVDLRHGPLKMKFCFRGYIKKIKTIQKGLHNHFQANAARVTLFSRHIDRISECIYTHISIVLSERGLDMDLMYPFDVSRLITAGKNIIPSYAMPRILSPMESASFHAFLRKIPVKALSQLQKYFIHLFGSRDIWTSSATAPNSAPPVGGKFMFPILPKGYKKQLLYDTLFKARRQHLQSLRSRAKQALALKIPVFDTEDAREFISVRRETFDPLSNFLVEALQKNDEVYQTILTSRKKGEFGGAFGFPPALRILKLIDIISAEDIVLILLQLSEQAVKQEQLRRAEEKAQSSDDTQRGLSRDQNPPLAAAGSPVSPIVNFEDSNPTSPRLGSPPIPPLSRKERGSIVSPNSRRKSVFVGDSSDLGMKARPPSMLSSKETSQTFSGRSGRMKGGKQQNQNDIQ